MLVAVSSLTTADQCAGQKDGTMLPDPENCHRFYICDGEQAWLLVCPGVLVWNIEGNTCDYPQNVDCGNRPLPGAPGATEGSNFLDLN